MTTKKKKTTKAKKVEKFVRVNHRVHKMLKIEAAKRGLSAGALIESLLTA